MKWSWQLSLWSLLPSCCDGVVMLTESRSRSRRSDSGCERRPAAGAGHKWVQRPGERYRIQNGPGSHWISTVVKCVYGQRPCRGWKWVYILDVMVMICFTFVLLNHARDALDIDSGTVQCTPVMQFAKPNKWFIGEIDKLIYSFHKTKGIYIRNLHANATRNVHRH